MILPLLKTCEQLNLFERVYKLLLQRLSTHVKRQAAGFDLSPQDVIDHAVLAGAAVTWNPKVRESERRTIFPVDSRITACVGQAGLTRMSPPPPLSFFKDRA